jgi:hypothetical protein
MPNQAGLWEVRDEPPWHDPYWLTHLAQDEKFANHADIDAAFSTGYQVFSDLPVFRNYFAHRNQRTREAAMRLAPKYGVGTTLKPSEVLRAVAPSGTVSVLHEWVNQLDYTLEYLCL